MKAEGVAIVAIVVKDVVNKMRRPGRNRIWKERVFDQLVSTSANEGRRIAMGTHEMVCFCGVNSNDITESLPLQRPPQPSTRVTVSGFESAM